MARVDEKAALDNFRREVNQLEEGICPTERAGGTDHIAQHPLYADCATEIVVTLRTIQTAIRDHAWTPRSTEQATARALRGRIETQIEIMERNHGAQ